jgi:hypothetical protein
MKELDGYETNPRTMADLVRNWGIRPNGQMGGGSGVTGTIPIGETNLPNRIYGWGVVFGGIGGVVGTIASPDMNWHDPAKGVLIGLGFGCALGLVIQIVDHLLRLLFGWLPAGFLGKVILGSVLGAVADAAVGHQLRQTSAQQVHHFQPYLAGGAILGAIFAFLRRKR